MFSPTAWPGKVVFSCTVCLVVVSTSLANDRPNILFVVADDMSHASIYGDQFLHTPNFDSIAREGLRFNRMYTPSSKCAPSRAVMLTGRNPWQLGCMANHKPVWRASVKSVVEVLSNNGYFAGFTGKGWDPGIHPKDRLLTGIEYNRLLVQDPPTSRVAKYDYAANFNEFLSDRPDDQPFFFWYGCKEPHRGYEFKSGVRTGKDLASLTFAPKFWPHVDVVKHDVLDYAVEVEYFDQHLGQILEHLKNAGELGNTLIIATSDNSMPFPRFKGHPHEYSTRVPFVAKWPGHIKKPGRECNDFASFIDLAPTFLEVANIGCDSSGMLPMQGKSLTDFFSDAVRGRDHVLTGRERNDMCRPNGWGYPVRCIHRGDFVYLHNFAPDRWPCGTVESSYRDTDGGPTKTEIMRRQRETPFYELCFGKRPQHELYNVVKDPWCVDNLASDKPHAATLNQLKTELFEKLAAQNDPRVNGNGLFFDECRPERQQEYAELVRQVKMKKTKTKK